MIAAMKRCGCFGADVLPHLKAGGFVRHPEAAEGHAGGSRGALFCAVIFFGGPALLESRPQKGARSFDTARVARRLRMTGKQYRCERNRSRLWARCSLSLDRKAVAA